jgi:ubiquinone/menaquinone biosynthesis C-methylase UbiE
MTGQIDAGRRGLRQRLFAWWYRNSDWTEFSALVDGYKRELFSGLHGDVVEIGPGTGDNFPYFPEGIRWIGIEPNVYMHPMLREAMTKSARLGEIHSGTAERMSLSDASVDVVVSTLVLCSVTSLDRSLHEILRVLRPGGRFAFLEHVAAPKGTTLRRTQKLIKPVWRFVADGCNPDRDIEAAIRRAGFSSVEITTFNIPEWIASPHIAGVAVK